MTGEIRDLTNRANSTSHAARTSAHTKPCELSQLHEILSPYQLSGLPSVWSLLTACVAPLVRRVPA
jgi:hypothetical protein